MAEETKKRVRRSADQLRADKIAALEEKIAKHKSEIKELEQQIAELKRPPQLSSAEKQALLKQKVKDGALSEEEAYQLGLK